MCHKLQQRLRLRSVDETESALTAVCTHLDLVLQLYTCPLPLYGMNFSWDSNVLGKASIVDDGYDINLSKRLANHRSS